MVNLKDLFKEFKSLDFLGYPNYGVNRDGQVCSLKHNNFYILGSYKDSSGYYSVKLFDNFGHCKMFKVHRLIALAFIPNPENKPQINHINGIKTDNRVENLEWVTALENNKHAWKTGLRNSVLRIDEQTVRKICELIEQGKQINEIAQLADVNRHFVLDIKYGGAWKEISKEYNFPAVKHHKNRSIRKESLVRKICRLLELHHTNKEIEKELHVSRKTISHIRNFESWAYIAKEYNIPREKNFITYSDEQVHQICKCLQNCMTPSSISGRLKIDQKYIRKIREGHIRKDISCQYNLKNSYRDQQFVNTQVVHEICKQLVEYKRYPYSKFARIAVKCNVDYSLVQNIYNKKIFTNISEQYPNIWP